MRALASFAVCPVFRSMHLQLLQDSPKQKIKTEMQMHLFERPCASFLSCWYAPCLLPENFPQSTRKTNGRCSCICLKSYVCRFIAMGMVCVHPTAESLTTELTKTNDQIGRFSMSSGIFCVHSFIAVGTLRAHPMPGYVRLS